MDSASSITKREYAYLKVNFKFYSTIESLEKYIAIKGNKKEIIVLPFMSTQTILISTWNMQNDE